MSKGKVCVIGLLAVVLILLMRAACSNDETPVGSPGRASIRQSNYGADWPLTVNSATLHCEVVRRFQGVTKRAVWVEVRGEKYGVNGTARGWLGETRWKLHDIWLDDSDFPGNKVSVDPLIQDGLVLCG